MFDDSKLWRYMSFSRFMWLLQNRQLWMSRADKLEDPWELAITQEEIDYLAARDLITPLGQTREETFAERNKRINELWRTTTYVNCWCALEYESHALWRVFCGSNEGIAIQTSWLKLSEVADNLRIGEIVYGHNASKIRTPQLEKVVLRKRQMFEYENEVRIIAHNDTSNPSLIKGEFGFQLLFDPERSLDTVVVHPEADQSFMDVVVSAVDKYSQPLRDRVVWSTMKERPPLLQP
jgi:hypothetical protein